LVKPHHASRSQYPKQPVSLAVEHRRVVPFQTTSSYEAWLIASFGEDWVEERVHGLTQHQAAGESMVKYSVLLDLADAEDVRTALGVSYPDAQVEVVACGSATAS
jgi:hypothetical protein